MTLNLSFKVETTKQAHMAENIRWVEEKRWGRREAVIYRLYGQQYIEPAVQGQSWYLKKCEERGTAYSC